MSKSRKFGKECRKFKWVARPAGLKNGVAVWVEHRRFKRDTASIRRVIQGSGVSHKTFSENFLRGREA
jgi:hypothetical protein